MPRSVRSARARCVAPCLDEARRSSAAVVVRPKLTRITSRAALSSQPIAASTWLGFMLPDEQALPAETAMPAMSNRISCAAAGDAGHPVAADRGMPRRCRRRPPRRPPRDRIVEPRAQRGHASRVLAARRARRRSRARAGRFSVPGAIAALLPAARRQRRQIADQQRADARRPAELVRRHRDEVGVRGDVGIACPPASARQSASSSPPAARTTRAISAIGWTHPGLAVRRLHRDQRAPARLGRAPPSATRSIRPVARPARRRIRQRRGAPHHARPR